MDKKLAKWINDLPIVEIIIGLFIILFLTIAIINVLMGGTLIEEKFIKDIIDNVIKTF